VDSADKAPEGEPAENVELSMEERLHALEERRRKLLKQYIKDANLTPKEAARRAGYSQPSVLYNYFSGRTTVLSKDLMRRMNKVMPGFAGAVANIDASVKAAPQFQDIGLRSVRMKMVARIGMLRAKSEIAADDQTEEPVPIDRIQRAAGAFGVWLLTPGFELVYPNNTLLVCIPVTRYQGPLCAGLRVVVERMRGARVEVSLREIAVEAARAYLLTRTASQAYQAPVSMPWPSDGTRVWKNGEDRFSIAGVVIGVYINFEFAST